MSLKDDLGSALKKVGGKWKKAKRHADKNDRVTAPRLYRMRYHAEPKETIKGVAFEVMEKAYQKASSNGKYPANARQIYYAARPEILSRLEKDELGSQYFTQTLIKDYLEERRPGWDVVWDARGHIIEPHTKKMVGLGGLEVRDYINRFTSKSIDAIPLYEPKILLPTTGPIHRFSNILFIEKEGFNPLLEAVLIQERFDIAITSSKGMPVAALCDLLSKMEELDVTAYCLHDFDVSGFTILKTLKQGARGSHGSGKVIDLGFRIDDIQGLQSEPVTPKGNIARKLRAAGATKEEIEFLQSDRVELNAMTSEEFVNWLEAKLIKVGVKKYVPDEAVIGEAYKRALYLTRLVEKGKELQKEFENSGIVIPDDLVEDVNEKLSDDSEKSWDEAIWDIVNPNGTGDSEPVNPMLTGSKLEPPKDTKPTIAEPGISFKFPFQCRILAKIPEAEIDRYIEEAIEKHEEISLDGLIAKHNKCKKKRDEFSIDSLLRFAPKTRHGLYKKHPGPAERKVVDRDVMKKEDDKETESAAALGRVLDNMDNIKDPWEAMEPLMKMFMGKVKKH